MSRTKAFELDFRECVARIMDAYCSTGLDDREAGLRWYTDAHTFAEGLAIVGGFDIDRVCGVIAVTSPTVGWEDQKQRIPLILGAYNEGRHAYRIALGLRRNIEKAFDILKDGNFDAISGKKVTSFFLNLLGNQDAVTVDRWAFRVATGLSVTQVPNCHYDTIVAAYRSAAKRLGLPPRELQAITWVWARRCWRAE